MEAPSGQEFRMSNGRVIGTVKELAENLAKVSEEEYNVHISVDHNDFSNWVRNALEEEDLAHELEVAKTKQEAVAALNNFTESEESNLEDDVEEVVSEVELVEETAAESEVQEEQPQETTEEPEVQENQADVEAFEKHLAQETHEEEHHKHHIHVHLEFVYGTLFGVLLALLTYGLYTLI